MESERERDGEREGVRKRELSPRNSAVTLL